VLAAWQYEVMLSKIERERREKELAELERKHLRLAGDFSYFCTVKKVFRRWSQETKRALKKREIELQAKLAREEELAKM
jgi:hypothetical protein